MHIEQFYEFCQAKKGVTEHFPFDHDTLVFKVGGKIFALTSLSTWETGRPAINLKCDPERAVELRAAYEGIQPGYHMSKMHWNTVTLNTDIPDKMIYDLISDSYHLVFKSLTKKNQSELYDL